MLYAQLFSIFFSLIIDWLINCFTVERFQDVTFILCVLQNVSGPRHWAVCSTSVCLYLRRSVSSLCKYFKKNLFWIKSFTCAGMYMFIVFFEKTFPINELRRHLMSVWVCVKIKCFSFFVMDYIVSLLQNKTVRLQSHIFHLKKSFNTWTLALTKTSIFIELANSFTLNSSICLLTGLCKVHNLFI